MLEAKIHANAEGADRRHELRLLVNHFQKLAVHLGPSREDSDWNRKREIIRSLIERIEIGRVGIVIPLSTAPRHRRLTQGPHDGDTVTVVNALESADKAQIQIPA